MPRDDIPNRFHVDLGRLPWLIAAATVLIKRDFARVPRIGLCLSLALLSAVLARGPTDISEYKPQIDTNDGCNARRLSLCEHTSLRPQLTDSVRALMPKSYSSPHSHIPSR